MRRRFDREMTQVNRRDFLGFIDHYYEHGDTSRLFGVSTFPQLRDDKVLAALSERPPTFNLVIVDEAHVMRNANTKTHQLGELLAQNWTAMLLLSATPVNLGSSDLFNLLALLRPDEFDSPAVFEALLEPNAHVNRAAQILRAEFPTNSGEALDELRGVEKTSLRDRYLNDPIYSDVLRRLAAPQLSRGEVIQLEGDVLGLNTLAHVYRQAYT